MSTPVFSLPIPLHSTHTFTHTFKHRLLQRSGVGKAGDETPACSYFERSPSQPHTILLSAPADRPPSDPATGTAETSKSPWRLHQARDPDLEDNTQNENIGNNYGARSYWPFHKQPTPAFTCLFRQENICFRNRSVGNLAYFGFLKIGLDVIEVCKFYSFGRKKNSPWKTWMSYLCVITDLKLKSEIRE